VSRFSIGIAFVLVSGCVSDAPPNMPKEIATSWCGQYRSESSACLQTAMEDHVNCLTATLSSSYNQCRSALLAERQAAEYK
jgi:hypothetical protein